MTPRHPTPHELDILLRLSETEPTPTADLRHLIFVTTDRGVARAVVGANLKNMFDLAWIERHVRIPGLPGKRRWAWTRTKAGTEEVERKP